jgi:hypothetical protein
MVVIIPVFYDSHGSLWGAIIGFALVGVFFGLLRLYYYIQDYRDSVKRTEDHIEFMSDLKEKFYDTWLTALWPCYNKPELDRRKIYWVGYKDYVLINYPAIVNLYYKGRSVDGMAEFVQRKYPELYNDEDWPLWAHEVGTTIKDAVNHFQDLGLMKKLNIQV